MEISIANALRATLLTLALTLTAKCSAEGVPAVGAATEQSLLSISEQCEFLEKVAANFERNQQAIRTWQGKATVLRSDFRDGDETTETVTTAKVTFALDRPGGKLIWTWTHEPRSVTAAGATSQEPHILPYNSGLATSEAFYRFPYGNPRDNREKKLPMSAAIFDPAKEKVQPFSADFDPMWYFTFRGEDVPERARFLARLIESGDRHWSVKRNGDLVTLETIREGLLNRYRYNLKLGGNLVLYHGSGGGGVEVYHWTYENRDSVWLPATWARHRVEDGPPQAPHPLEISATSIRFTTTSLNEELPTSTFALSKLGLQPGDVVLDTRTDERRDFRGDDSQP